MSNERLTLNDIQIRSCIAQVNCTTENSLNIELDQLINLCVQQEMNIDELIEHARVSLCDNTSLTFSLTSIQMAQVFHRYNHVDRNKLLTIEQDQREQMAMFRLTPSQLSYLIVHHCNEHNRRSFGGITYDQFIGLFALQEQLNNVQQRSIFMLTETQRQQLTHRLGTHTHTRSSSLARQVFVDVLSLMELDVTFDDDHTLNLSINILQSTVNRLMNIIEENQTAMPEILACIDQQRPITFDCTQVCRLIHQHSSMNRHERSFNERFYLTMEQILNLARYSTISLKELLDCSNESTQVSRI
jgi:hypothetical protein